jgi:hypothetical protein
MAAPIQNGVFCPRLRYRVAFLLLAAIAIWACDSPGPPGYYFSENQADVQPYLYYGSENRPSATPVEIYLPCPGETFAPLASDPPLFQARREENGKGCRLVISVSEPVWNFQSAETVRSGIRSAYRDFLIRLEATGQEPEFLYQVKAAVASTIPMTFEEVLFYRYGFDPENGYIDLHPGMRVRVDFQVYQFVGEAEGNINGYVGSGTSFYPIVRHRQGREMFLGFNGFLERIQPTRVENPKGGDDGGAGGLIDFKKPGRNKAFYRLFYPTAVSAGYSPGSVGPRKHITLVGADTLKDLAAATRQYLENQDVEETAQTVVVYFRGRALVIPEIAVLVNQTATHVPVGTRVRDLVERSVSIAPRNLVDRIVFPFDRWHGPVQDAKAPDRSRFTRVPVGRKNSGHRYWNGTDTLDLPLVAGDALRILGSGG